MCACFSLVFIFIFWFLSVFWYYYYVVGVLGYFLSIFFLLVLMMIWWCCPMCIFQVRLWFFYLFSLVLSVLLYCCYVVGVLGDFFKALSFDIEMMLFCQDEVHIQTLWSSRYPIYGIGRVFLSFIHLASCERMSRKYAVKRTCVSGVVLYLKLRPLVRQLENSCRHMESRSHCFKMLIAKELVMSCSSSCKGNLNHPYLNKLFIISFSRTSQVIEIITMVT